VVGGCVGCPWSRRGGWMCSSRCCHMSSSGMSVGAGGSVCQSFQRGTFPIVSGYNFNFGILRI
jgi:hypothetical protein